jgi:hypothetical protein
MQKPVYSLVKGDVFIAQDNQAWTVDELVKPSDVVSLPQIGEANKAYTILAHRGQTNRRFYHHGGKLVTINGGK